MSASKSMLGMGPAIPHTVPRETMDLRDDCDKAFKWVETPGHRGTGVVAVEEWLAPGGGDILYWLGATAFSAAAQHVHSSSGQLAEPRNVVLDFVITAGVPAGDVVVKGLDIDGVERTVTVPVPAATSLVDAKVPLKLVKSVDIPPHGGAFTGTVSVGFGDAIGLGSPIKARSFGPHILQELYDGVPAVVAGAFANKLTAPPYGSYTPNTPPAGAVNYLLTYERDNT